MVEWFWRRRRTVAPRLTPRGEAPATRVDLHEFTPAPAEFLARAAYVELTLSELLSRAVAMAPTTAEKAVLAECEAAVLARYATAMGELQELGIDGGEAMGGYREFADRFQRMTRGHDWAEAALTGHLAGGFLADLFGALADGLPAPLDARVREAYRVRPADAAFVAMLSGWMAGDERRSARMALWGRRVLGDALLVARDAIGFGAASTRNDEERVEPAFSELVAEHTRRMDALGLSA